MDKFALGILCWLVLGTVRAEQSVLWVVRPDFLELGEFQRNLTFPVRGTYEDCSGNCSCETLFWNNVDDLLNWAEFVKKINVGTVSRGRFLKTGIRGDGSGLWEVVDFFLRKVFKADFAGERKEDIFSRMLREFQGRGRRFLMIAVQPDLQELDKLLKVKDNKTTTIITGACGRKSPYLATENQKLFESIKTIYEIPHVVRSILDNCNGLCNNTISRVKNRVARSNDDEMIQYEKLDEEPEPQSEEEPEEERDLQNSSSNLTKNLIIVVEFVLTLTLAFV